MKTTTRIAILAASLFAMLLIDLPFLGTVDDAEAVLGVRRRTARRTAVVVGSAGAAATASASAQAAAAEQQAAAAQAEAEAAQQQAAAAQAENEQLKAAAAAPPAPAPATAPAPALPLGTVVGALPAGCVSTVSGNQELYHCGNDFYKAAFQGSQLVYVTTSP